MGHRAVIVVGGGGPVAPGTLAHLPPGAPVVAADSGIDGALALGLRVDVAVGDFDSVTSAGLAAAEAAGAVVERHPADKDATDLALAIDAAAAMVDDGGELVVLGTEGGRLDHLLAGLLALTDPALPRLRAHLGSATVHVLHGPQTLRLDAAAGALVTLLPVGGDATGVRTEGLRYPLHGERLAAGTTRGVSNVVVADADAVDDVDAGAVVSLEAGTLLVVLP
jgi:thiamine pyrophosphokinase